MTIYIVRGRLLTPIVIVLEKYIICDVCTVKSPAFETTSLLYITSTDCTSMQELLMQEHKKMYRTCSCCGRDTWHIESKQILQPPKYLIIILNRIIYSNNRITKNKSRMPLDLYIKLGPHKIVPTSFCGPSWILYEQWSLHSLDQLLWEYISL